METPGQESTLPPPKRSQRGDFHSSSIDSATNQLHYHIKCLIGNFNWRAAWPGRPRSMPAGQVDRCLALREENRWRIICCSSSVWFGLERVSGNGACSACGYHVDGSRGGGP
jgi:hypothetical protein